MIIHGREIGPEQSPYIVAEASCNHGGTLERALSMIWWAKHSGADAIKFQAYGVNDMTLYCGKPDFMMKDGPWKGRMLWDLYDEAKTPYHWFPAIAAKAKEVGITWFASVFSKASVDLVDKLGAPAFKIASFEITDLPLIRYTASKGKPVIVSTGMANIDETIDVAAEIPWQNRAMLHCVSAYPAKPEDYDLHSLKRSENNEAGITHGISDHTLGHDLAVAATACGARIIEKHFTLARELGGPDAGFSTEPHEFKKMVKAVRATWQAMQPKKRAESEVPQRQARRSLYCVKDLAKGEVVTEAHVRSIRPGYGLAPKEIDKVIGRRVKRNVYRGEALNWEMFE